MKAMTLITTSSGEGGGKEVAEWAGTDWEKMTPSERGKFYDGILSGRGGEKRISFTPDELDGLFEKHVLDKVLGENHQIFVLRRKEIKVVHSYLT